MRHSYLLIIAIMLTVISSRTASAQSIAVKSNILYDLTGTLNLGGEIRCDDTHSFSLSVNYNPWNLGENKKMKHILVQPEYRWWLNETFIGSFFGVQAHFAQYNFSGVTYGHQWLLSTFWSLEASISVGYAHLTYDKYGPAKGDALIKQSHSNYFGPTQIGISFIYFIQ